MASKKGGGGGNFRDRFTSLTGAAGNHPEAGKNAVSKAGRVSFEEKSAKATGKENPNIEANRHNKEVKQIISPANYDNVQAKLRETSKSEPEKEK